MSKVSIDVLWREIGVAKGISELNDGLDRAADKHDKFKERARTAFLLGGAAAVAFGASSVKAYAEAESAQAKLEDAFARFPALADTNIESLRDLNSELQKKTRFDDDAIASGQAVLANFNLTGKQLQELTPTLLDYAAKTGQDVPEAAEKLGKSFLGNTKALKELGINYHSTGNQAKDTENIIRLLRNQVGGFAEKEGKTAAGQAAILRNQFGEIQEQVGAKLLPALIQIGKVAVGAFQWVQDNKGAALVITGIVAAVWLLNAALAANPAVLIAAGIAVLIGAIVVLWTKSAAFREVVINVWNTIKSTVESVVRFLVSIWEWYWGIYFGIAMRIRDVGVGIFNGAKEAAVSAKNWIVDRWNDIVDFFTRIPDRVGHALGGIAGIIGNVFRGAVNAVVGALNWAVDHTLNWLVDRANDVIRWVPGVPYIPKLPHIPMMHTGGIVPGASGTQTLTLLEAGEIVLPANGGGRRGNNIVLNINAPIGSRQELENWLVKALDNLNRRGRGRFA